MAGDALAPWVSMCISVMILIMKDNGSLFSQQGFHYWWNLPVARICKQILICSEPNQHLKGCGWVLGRHVISTTSFKWPVLTLDVIMSPYIYGFCENMVIGDQPQLKCVVNYLLYKNMKFIWNFKFMQPSCWHLWYKKSTRLKTIQNWSTT